MRGVLKMNEKDKKSPFRNFAAEAFIDLAATRKSSNPKDCCYHKVPMNEVCAKCDAGGNGRYGIHTMPNSERECRDDGRCQYAIDHGAEGLGHCPLGKCCMPLPAPPAPQAKGAGHE